MFNKFKKAYISIEVVILASIVIIGGMCGLSAFLKNGQNAQSQSAEAMNDVIDMIGEEFDFSIGSGELPGGGGLPGGGEFPGGGETDADQYGFYFGQDYACTFQQDLGEDAFGNDVILPVVSVVNFYEDGSAKIRVEVPFTATYSNGKAYINEVGSELTFAENGKGIIQPGAYDNQVSFRLLDTPTHTQNSYGFYFNEKYEMLNPGIIVGGYWEFEEDGDARLVEVKQSIPTGSLTYAEGEISMGGTVVVTFSDDGKTAYYGGMTYILVE